jgi:hypothetical protein
MQPLLYHLPLWLTAVLIVGLCVGLACGGVALARRKDWQVHPDDNTGAGFLHAFVGVLYAVALGLMVVMVQEEYHDVEDSVVAEASAVGDIYRALDAVREPARSGLRAELREYVRLTVDVEWPAIRRGGQSLETWMALDRFTRHLVRYRPTDEDAAVHDHLLGDLDEMLDARRARIYQGQQGIGTVTWSVILVGGLVTLGFTCVFRMNSHRAQTVLTAATAAMYGLMLFLVVVMDHPLWGNFSVGPGSFEQLRGSWLRIEGERGDTLPGMPPPSALAAPGDAAPAPDSAAGARP